MVCHPFQCRLPSETTFAKDNPSSLVGVGFISIALAIFTAFRITPAILLTFMFSIRGIGGISGVFIMNGPILIYSWLALILVSLFVGGMIMVFSGRIRKRSVLLFQPWALLLLYLDGLFWLSITMYLNIGLRLSGKSDQGPTKDVPYSTAYFTVIYIDIVLFIIVHFYFASYYITAELTVIENFF